MFDWKAYYSNFIYNPIQEQKMTKIKRNSYAIVTLDSDGKEDLKVLTKTISANYGNSFAEAIVDEDDAEQLATDAAKHFKRVYLVEIKAIYRNSVEDLLDS